jgi:hypothetical protein
LGVYANKALVQLVNSSVNLRSLRFKSAEGSIERQWYHPALSVALLGDHKRSISNLLSAFTIQQSNNVSVLFNLF